MVPKARPRNAVIRKGPDIEYPGHYVNTRSPTLFGFRAYFQETFRAARIYLYGREKPSMEVTLLLHYLLPWRVKITGITTPMEVIFTSHGCEE